MSLKRKAESLFQSLFSDVSADSHDVEHSRYRRHDQSEEGRNDYRQNDELAVRNQYRRSDGIEEDRNNHRRYPSDTTARNQCRRYDERNHDPHNDDGPKIRIHNGRYNRIEDEQSGFNVSEGRVRSETAPSYGRADVVGWSRCSPRSDESRGGEGVLWSRFSPRPLTSRRDSVVELYGRREIENSRSNPRPTESFDEKSRFNPTESHKGESSRFDPSPTDSSDRSRFNPSPTVSLADERMRFNPSPTESHENGRLRYGTSESFDEQATKFGEDAHEDELLRYGLPTDVYERREQNEKSSGRKTVTFVEGVQRIPISSDKVGEEEEEEEKKKKEEKKEEEDLFQKDLFEKRSVKSLPSSLTGSEGPESTITSDPDSTSGPLSASTTGPGTDFTSGPSPGSVAVMTSSSGPSPGPSAGPGPGPVSDGIGDSLDQRLKMFQVSSPYQRMFNPDLRDVKTEAKSSVVAEDREDSRPSADMEGNRTSADVEDNAARAERNGKTLLVPPLRALEAYTMPAVKDMPPTTDAPSAVKVLSEVLFSIKTSIHRSNRTIVSEAIGEANAEWDEAVEDCNGIPEYKLFIEGVLVGSRVDSSTREARETTLELFVRKAQSCDYLRIVSEENPSGYPRTDVKLQLFASHDDAVKGAFRYDLLCAERFVSPDRIPVCEYCRESGHNDHFCPIRRAVSDLVRAEKAKSERDGSGRSSSDRSCSGDDRGVVQSQLRNSESRSTETYSINTYSTNLPSTNLPSTNPATYVDFPQAPMPNGIISNFKMLSEQIIRGDTAPSYGLSSVGSYGPSSLRSSTPAYPSRLLGPSLSSHAVQVAGYPLSKGPVTTPYIDVSMPPPSLPDVRSPPPSILPMMTMPPPNLLPLNQPPPTSPHASSSLTHNLSRDALRQPLSSLSGNSEVSSNNNNNNNNRSNVVEEVLSEEEKLKVKVIQSNLREIERRKASEVSKSFKKSNPTKSKNLISLV